MLNQNFYHTIPSHWVFSNNLPSNHHTTVAESLKISIFFIPYFSARFSSYTTASNSAIFVSCASSSLLSNVPFSTISSSTSNATPSAKLPASHQTLHFFSVLSLLLSSQWILMSQIIQHILQKLLPNTTNLIISWLTTGNALHITTGWAQPSCDWVVIQ